MLEGLDTSVIMIELVMMTYRIKIQQQMENQYKKMFINVNTL